MTKILISFILLLLLPFSALAKTLKVAVIDTGVSSHVHKLCTFGHKSMANNDSGLNDIHGHGTHIAGIISHIAGEKLDYCIVSIKYYSEWASGSVNLERMIHSIQYAMDLNVDIINISGGGPQASAEEKILIQRALDRGIKVIAAAGNDNKNLNNDCYYYPACYDRRITVVGNLDDVKVKLRAPSSNYGSMVARWEIGTNVKSNCINGKNDCENTGTSQATAIATGKIIKEMLSAH